ncbi:MAG: ComEC/Rec2 family competence protein [Pseudomonadota bacterium]
MADQDRTDKVALGAHVLEIYRIESRRFVLWLPVLLGIGIWIYFALPNEPDPRTVWIWLPFLTLALLPLRGLLAVARIICGLCAVAAFGFAMASWSAHRADAPQIRFPVGETVEGRVLWVSRSASGAPRLLLDDVTVYGLEPGQTPARVRLTVLDGVHSEMPGPGTIVRTYATLLPPGEPVEPGAFDFRRRAFFERLGAIGLVRGALLTIPEEDRIGVFDAAWIWIARQRDALSRALRTMLPGRQGAFAAAIIVGDRAEIDEADAEALRASNLAHLLAISGLHMGMLTGLVFASLRLMLAAIPLIAMSLSTRKIAAIGALAVGASYLALSGGTVATQRAYIMVAVAFTAVLVDRPALTLRALALAAVIVLMLRPISLLDAGFQMSFAATAALVAGFEQMRGTFQTGAFLGNGLAAKVLRAVLVFIGSLLASSLLAGLATAPFAAYHFNRSAPYGLLSNMLALPVMGFWIAPSACIAAVLAPIGLAEPALQVMGAGIEQVLRVAHWVSSLPGAVRYVPAGPALVLPLVALGGLWFLIWRGSWRFAGVLIVLAGFWFWHAAEPRPDILIAPNARLIGVLGPDGRVLDHPTAQGFAAKSWLRRDGDPFDQETAAGRPGLERTKGAFASRIGDWTIHAVRSRKIKDDKLADLCDRRVILIARHGGDLSGDCIYLGARSLARSGAIAIRLSDDEVEITLARDPARQRLWSPQ